MRTLALLALACLLSGCAGTKFYHENGTLAASFDGDMQDCEYRKTRGAIYWKARTVSHSAATRARGDNITKAGTAVGAAALMLKGF